MPNRKILFLAPETDSEFAGELEELGWTVVHCHDLDAAVDELVRDDSYFIMICAEEAIDAQFPSGLDLIRWIRNPFGSSLPAILLQSSADTPADPRDRLPPYTNCHRMDMAGIAGLQQTLSFSLHASMN